MRKYYKEFTTIIKKAIVGVLICIMGMLFSWSDGSFAASAKDKKIQKVAPSLTQTPSETAPSPTASPPSSMQKKEGLPEIHKDLAVQGLIVTPNEFSLGERINVVFDIHNLGPTHISQVSYEVRIGFQMLFSDTLRNLSPGSITGVKREVTIPQNLRPGRWFIRAGIFLDDDNIENNFTRQSVIIRLGYPNLVVGNPQIIRKQSGPLQAGSLFDLKYIIINNGQLDSMPCKYKVKTERLLILSMWRVIDERSYDIPPLSPSEFTEVSPTFQIPEDLPAGADLRITIYVDSMNQITESSEEDNKRVIKVHY